MRMLQHTWVAGIQPLTGICRSSPKSLYTAHYTRTDFAHIVHDWSHQVVPEGVDKVIDPAAKDYAEWMVCVLSYYRDTSDQIPAGW